jgi:hypothetical protein
MKSQSRNSKFLSSLKAVGCDVDNLTPLSETHELPKKLLKFVSGGKTGFSRSKSGSGDTFKRVDFYRALHH